MASDSRGFNLSFLVETQDPGMDTGTISLSWVLTLNETAPRISTPSLVLSELHKLAPFDNIFYYPKANLGEVHDLHQSDTAQRKQETASLLSVCAESFVFYSVK